MKKKMTTSRHINPKEFHLTYGVHQGGYWLEPGEIISTYLPDAHGFDANNVRVAGLPNPLVGPFLVRGAKPGDTLIVNIRSLTPNRTTGFACKNIHPNIQNPPLPLTFRRKEYVAWYVDPSEKVVRPNDSYFPNHEINLPLLPVLGCLGLALNKDDFSSSNDCGMYGGNMDYPRITLGTTVYLPIFVEHAYLYIGDGHALQGAGEITGNGIEVSFDIKFSVQLGKIDLSYPAGEDSHYLFTIGNEKSLEQSLRIATQEMTKWLINHYSFNQDQVGILLGQLVNYEIGNFISNVYSVACCFPKSFLFTRR